MCGPSSSSNFILLISLPCPPSSDDILVRVVHVPPRGTCLFPSLSSQTRDKHMIIYRAVLAMQLSDADSARPPLAHTAIPKQGVRYVICVLAGRRAPPASCIIPKSPP